MSKLKKGARKLYDFLHAKRAGDTVTEAEIVTAAGWPPEKSTLTTYLRKNKLSRFIANEGDVFRVLRDGRELTEDEFYAEFTQVNPEQLVLRPGLIFESDPERYRLLNFLGSGATGQVWLAEGNLGTVAIKIFDPRRDLLKPTIEDDIRARFAREGKHGAKLDHAHVVRVLGTGTYTGRPFIIMEHAAASARQLATREQLPPKLIHQLVGSACDGLQYLHRCNLVHRDVKPDNVLALDRGFVLGDLGIVRWTDFNQDTITAGTITRHALQLGSWYYMAPEQRSSPHDAIQASDVYALGVTWYELLTGTLPAPESFAAKATEPIDGDLEVTEMIGKMTSYRPADRPTLDEVRQLAMARSS